MHTVILHMAALIACGVIWRLLWPGGLDADITRHVLTSLVYYLLLPALVIQVLWKAPLGIGSLGIGGSAAVGSYGVRPYISHLERLKGLETNAAYLRKNIEI